jgi:hypothetical protein
MSSQFPDLSKIPEDSFLACPLFRKASWFVLQRWVIPQNDSEASLLSPEVSWGQLIQVLSDLAVCLLNASDLPHLGLQVRNLLKKYILPKIRQICFGEKSANC